MLADAATDSGRVRSAIDHGELIASVSDDDEMVGYALVGREGDDVHLEELAVDPAFGRRGRGTALLLATLGLASRTGAQRVTLVTLDFVPFGRSFYEARGFRRLERDELTATLRELAPPEVRDGRVAMARAVTPPR